MEKERGFSAVRLLGHWLRARLLALGYTALVFGIFFLVYFLYGYEWGVAGYAALVALAAGAGLAVWDFARFVRRHAQLTRITGRFPTEPLPEPRNLPEADYTRVIRALEAERARLEQENEHARRDAEEYYTLWAHQIKTPLAALRLLLQSAGEDLPRALRADMEQELLRTGQYVDMVLQYQRLSSLENDLTLERLSLAALVNKAAKACAPLFIYKGLALDVGGVEGTVVTDEKWLCFVLEQLLSNAAKYTPPGGLVKVYSPDGHSLAVEDNGRGIPAGDVPRVFERGFTGAVGRAERSSTGIGLYLCRQILARLGFGISLKSAPAQGTRVLLDLTQQELELD